MADPLSLLREYVSAGKVDEVVVSDGRVDFGGKFSFSKAVPTGYKSQQGKGKFYDLETLLFFARNLDIKFAEYFKKAGKEEVGKVTLVDRLDLQNFLTGKTDRSEFIQLAVPDFEVEHPAKRARLEAGGEAAADEAAAGEEDATDAALRKIRENELQLRDRNSIISMPGRSFRKALNLLSQTQREQRQAEEKARQEERRRRPSAPKPVIPVKPSGRYERQTQQDATLKQMGAAELGVQVGFKPATAAAAAAGGSAQRGAAPPPPPAAAQQQQPRPRPPARSPAAARSPAKAAPQRAGTPIIMVPPGMTSLLSMWNVRAFLEEGRFRTVAEAKADLEAAKKPVKREERAVVLRTVGRKKPVKYYVTDKEPASPSDWNRVVAVICLGKAWQFKKWPFKGAAGGDLVETFSRVMGAFVHYSDEAVDATVKSWNVKPLALNRGSRHRDATVAQEFWRLLDAHLAARGSTLAY